MHDATLCFLVDGYPPERILMGLKKAGFGAGKFTGFGGKVEAHETIRKAAVREMAEETGVKVADNELKPIAQLTFLFPEKPDWSQIVHVFFAVTWEGEPAESVEMRPFWFDVDAIPYEGMWQDGAHWLPRILAGERIRASFRFRADNETVESADVVPWDGANPIRSVV
jgi:8-oxo-dGTP pyrophosphatase MutT (NUDIX family)